MLDTAYTPRIMHYIIHDHIPHAYRFQRLTSIQIWPTYLVMYLCSYNFILIETLHPSVLHSNQFDTIIQKT